VKWPTIITGSLQRVNSLEPVQIGIAFETKFLNETNGDPVKLKSVYAVKILQPRSPSCTVVSYE
jgi:hypothetical protein